MKNLESKIKKKLSERSMTIQRLATESGIAEPTIYSIFNRDDAKISQLIKISEALNTSLNYFLEEFDASALPLTQTGDFNQAGHGNRQKIHVSKSPGPELAEQLAACRRELALSQALILSQGETITLLKGSRNNPN